jgi:ABC-type nitrate/sulfonate/bicarbonate transport system permease component
MLVAVRSLLVLAVVWTAISWWVDNPVLLPDPFAVASAFVSLAASGELWDNASVTLLRLGLALAIATGLAVPAGLLMGLSEAGRELLDPVVELLRPISGIAWIPLALFIFGIGDTLPLFIMSYAAFFPLLFNTIAGVRMTDPHLVAAARTLGLGRRAIVQRVIVPAALPSILVGLRLAVGSAWTATIAAELIGAPSGLGFAIEWYRELLMTPKVLAVVCVIAVLGLATDRLIRALQRHAAGWALATGVP